MYLQYSAIDEHQHTKPQDPVCVRAASGRACECAPALAPRSGMTAHACACQPFTKMNMQSRQLKA